ncbi:MAG: class I mannose-6-phosphate isomerase [Armatimonadetes bacterium]|nr:class I mannose-6-phosphate isomerase [Armatimonadota bacterium]
MDQLYPLLCVPHCQPRIWGGRRLAELYGKALPPDEPIGETWEVADLPEGHSTIGNGRWQGAALGEVVAAWGGALIGSAWPAGRFPLLVKLLDAQDDLSVQVHPSDDDCARLFPTHHGKDESWVILHSEAGSILHGAVEGQDWERFAAALAADRALDCLRRVEVAPGDVFRVAPGTIHALGRGVVVLEIQQPSDSTFRLYDYGRGRQLHLEESRQVICWDSSPEPRALPRPLPATWGGRELLVDVPAYRLERLRLEREATWSIDPRSVQCLTVLSGRGRLAGADLTLSPGRTILVPAQLGRVTITPDEPLTVVLAGAGGVPLAEAC